MLQEEIHEKHADLSSRVIHLPAAPAPLEADDPRVDLKELIRVIKRRRVSILWTAAVPAVAALLYVLIATPLYTASTQLLLDPRDRRIVSNEVTPEALAPDGGIAVVESQLLVVTSDTVLRRVIARENLGADPEFGASPTGLAGVLYGGLAAIGIQLDGEGGDPELKALRALKKRIGAKRSDKAYVVDVYVTTNARDKSVRIADGIGQAYLDDQASARAAASGRASAALTGRLDALRNRVQEAENRVVAYKEQHNIVAAGGVLVNEQQLSDITIQLSTARAKTAETRARYDQIIHARQAGNDIGAISEAVASQTIGQLRTQYAEVARQRAQVGAIVGPRHPLIANLDAQVRDLQKLINEELARITMAAQNDLDRAQAMEQSLEKSLEQFKKNAGETNQASVRLRELEREAEVSRVVYQAFLVRARETGEQQSIDNSNARVISRATPPRDTSWPPRLLLVALALICGLGIGTGVGLMREYFDERIYSIRTLQDVAGVPTLAVLPTRAQWPGRWMAFAGLVRSRRRVDGPQGESLGQTKLLIAAMRRLRDGLFPAGKPQLGRSVLVTSPTDGEDHTAVALNLALTAAEDGWRVLLIDADIERATLSKTLDAAGNAGLLDLIEGRAMLASVLVRDTDTSLSFLPLGNKTGSKKPTPSPQELAQRLTFANFDLTIIDGGPVLADEHMRSFAGFADDLLLVVRAGGPTRNNVQSALGALRINVRKLRGAVLTRATDDTA